MSERAAGGAARWFERPAAHAVAIALGCLLAATCLTVGFTSDDHVHRVKQDPASTLGGFEHAPWALFSFISGEPAQRAAGMQSGVLSWWTAEDLQLSFFRPLSTLTHHLDNALWRDAAPMAYLHGLVWFALLLIALSRLYRRLHSPWVAWLALAAFAWDDAHGPTLGFIANRNAVIAALLGVCALLALDRYVRDRWRPGFVVGPLCALAALFAAEAGVATFGYVAAYLIAMDQRALRVRGKTLAPYAAAFVLWWVVYKIGGYGAHGSGVYIDPIGEAPRFLGALIERFPPLFLAQVGPFWSDFWVVLPPPVQHGVWLWAVGSLVWLAYLLWPLVHRSPVLQFWALGMAFSLVPIAATVPADRLLMAVGLGAMPLLATLIGAALQNGHRPRTLRAVGIRLTGWGMLLLHLVLAPLLLPVRAQSMETIQRSMVLIDAAAPPDDAADGATLVVVSAPGDGFVSYTQIRRASLNQPAPAAVRLLSTTVYPTEVTRVDAFTLRIRPETGMLSTEPERILRSEDAPFAIGDTVRVDGMVVTVTELREWWPQEIEVTFDTPLEDGTRRWVAWMGAGFEPFALPAVGETVILPATLLAETFEAITTD